MQAYEPKTRPYEHQARVLRKDYRRTSHALFWEQGTGKSKAAIDNACMLYEEGEISFVLIVAPNGVHANWVREELPTHVPDRVMEDAKVVLYETPKAGNKWHIKMLKDALAHEGGLVIVSISYNGLMTNGGAKFVRAMMDQRKCFYILDEAHFIKTPSAKRTTRVIASGRHAKYRRLLTGTPITQGPFDLYSQVRFLEPNFWHEQRIGKFAAFKFKFGVWRTRQQVVDEVGFDPGYDELLGYKNLDKLTRVMERIGDRVTKDEVLDLPPKVYSRHQVDLNYEQWRVYKQLKEEFYAELSSGDFVEAPLAITRLLRLQQTICGYVAETEQPLHILDGPNYRLEALEAITDSLAQPAIIWARFRKDVDLICDLLGERAARYDGHTQHLQREKNLERFHAGERQFFVANPAVGSTGLTLNEAKTVIYYSNSFNLVDRLQSEDRCHRIGQDQSVQYIDIVAPGTVDEHIIRALREKRDVASQITGDEIMGWLEG